MWREKEGLFALGCCSSKNRETGVCTGHQLSDTAKQLSLSKSELPLKLVNMEQEKTLCTTRIPREVFKLKGSKPGQNLSGRSSHIGAQSPLQEHFLSITPAFSSSLSARSIHKRSLLSVHSHLHCQCICFHIFILVGRIKNWKLKFKKPHITIHTPNVN